MLAQTLHFIRRNIGTMVVIDKDGKRENIPEYPMIALKEAVANALIHRDYSISRESAYIYVQIYDDRIEIINHGDLYGNNKLENLGTDIMLEARNKHIVRLLEEKGNIIENRHTGIATMREEMKQMGLPEPEFYSLRGDFKVVFRKVKNESVQKWTEVDRKEQITDFEKEILDLIKINSKITQQEMCKITGAGRTTITNNLRKLKQNNLIERVGSDRKGYWKIL